MLLGTGDGGWERRYCIRTMLAMMMGAPLACSASLWNTASTIKMPMKPPTNAHHQTSTFPIWRGGDARYPSIHEMGFGRRWTGEGGMMRLRYWSISKL